MKRRKAVLQLMRRERLVGVIRAPTQETAERAARACVEGGVRLLEIPLTVPGALGLIKTLSALPEACIGAGSILDREMAREAVAYGAQYIISPHTDSEVVQVCEEEDVFVATGALTPTEVARAWNLGVDAVNVFPAAAVGGPEYVRALKRPFPFIEMLPAGGITLENCRAYLEAGALALGVADALLDRDAIERGQWSQVRETARELADRVRLASGASG